MLLNDFYKNAIEGTYVIPQYSGLSIANIASTILKHYGIATTPLPPLNNEIFSDVMLNKSNIIFIVLDGLGYNFFSEFVKKYKKSYEMFPVTSVFPSTTASALPSMFTGCSPSMHGMIGYTMLLPSSGTAYNMLTMTPVNSGRVNQPINKHKLNGFINVKTIFQMLSEHGVRSVTFNREGLVDTSLSSMLYRGSHLIGYSALSDMFLNAKKIIENMESHRWFITIYYDRIDAIFHQYGVDNDMASREVKSFLSQFYDLLISKLSSIIKDNTMVIITGDHGHVPFFRDKILIYNNTGMDNYMRMPPTGDPRALFLHTTAENEPIISELLKRYTPFRYLMMEKKDSVTLFGPEPYHKEFYSRIGDYLLVPDFGGSYHVQGISHGNHYMKAGHGGMDINEMIVPLVYSFLNDFI